MTGQRQMDPLDRALLNLLQTDFPLVERPYLAIGERVAVHENEVIDRIAALKSAGLIREISAIFDSGRLGYRSVLVAMEVPRPRLDEVGMGVSAGPEVSHCYARDHRYNLWFTLTAPPGVDPAERARAIQSSYRVERALVLPALRRFKIGVNFDVGEVDSRPATQTHPAETASSRPSPAPNLAHDVDRPGVAGRHDPSHGQAGITSVSDLDWALVRELQRDLPVVPRPFLPAASRLAMDEKGLLAQIESLQARGLMRRFAAVLRHRVAGFLGNGMSCWRVPPDRVEGCGLAMAAWPSVTHCYERATSTEWPYGLFAMLHARTRDECLQDAGALSAHLGERDYLVLLSHHEYKKERVRYSQPSCY